MTDHIALAQRNGAIVAAWFRADPIAAHAAIHAHHEDMGDYIAQSPTWLQPYMIEYEAAFYSTITSALDEDEIMDGLDRHTEGTTK